LPGAVALIVVVSLIAGQAAADERVIFVASGVARGDAQGIAQALRDDHRLEVVDETRVRVLLSEQAAALPPDRAAEAAGAAIDEAEAAWADLRLEPARERVQGALAGLLGAPRPPPVTLVARALFVRSLIDDAAGRRTEAARALEAALVLDGALAASPDRHGPPVQRAVEAARKRGPRAADATLRIAGLPAGATVEVDGAARSEGDVAVASGPHLVVARAIGYRPRALLVEVSGTTAPAIALEPAPPALAASQVLEALAAGAATAALLRVAARALGIPRVMEAASTERGRIEIRVWSAAGARLATLPDPRHALPSARETAARAARGEGVERVGSRGGGGLAAAWWIGAGAVVAVGAVVATVLLTSGDGDGGEKIVVIPP
jgi:hypothetical protein